MFRVAIAVFVLLHASLSAVSATAAPRSLIISQSAAARHGLARPWIAQVQMDHTRSRLEHLTLYEGVLYAQSDRAMTQAIDAETGQTIWMRQIGRPNHPSLAAGAGGELLALVNGSRLYVVNRHNGDLLLERELSGAPGAGPALSRRRAYVPMLNGLMVAYRVEPLTDPMRELGRIPRGLTEEDQAQLLTERREDIRLNQEFTRPVSAQSYGRATVQPVVMTQSDIEEYVTWATERGFLYTGSVDPRDPDRLETRYRLGTGDPIVSRAAYLPPPPGVAGATGTIFTASRDGYVYALAEKTGETVWRYSCGEAIVERPALVAPRLFITTQLGGMFSLDVATGRQQWWAPHVRQFVAASDTRVYAFDMTDQLLVLDIETGARLDSLFTGPLPVRLSNDLTDRIYLASETGLIQCLHELELPEPLRHNQAEPPRRERREAVQEGLPQPPRPEDRPAQPDAQEADPFGDADDPFRAAPQEQPPPQDAPEADPFGGAADEADPFGQN